jgi:hypothetical protein
VSARRKKSATKQFLTFKQKERFRKAFKQLARQARQLDLQIRDLKEIANIASFRIP